MVFFRFILNREFDYSPASFDQFIFWDTGHTHRIRSGVTGHFIAIVFGLSSNLRMADQVTD